MARVSTAAPIAPCTFTNYLANRLISLLFNALYNQTLSDIETCYKMMTAQVAGSLRLSADDFGAEVEISANIARHRKLRIYELGITLLWPQLRRGQEDKLEGRRQGALVSVEIQVCLERLAPF